jgi:hypothetical protein
MQHGQLLRRGPRLHSASTSVIANPIAAAVRHRVIVDIVHNGNIYVGHRAVVTQRAVIPIRAVIATAGITVAVVDAAIKANMRTPVARVPLVDVIVVAPPGRRPKRAYIRGHNPGAWNPVIAGTGIAPVAWRPNIIVAGSGRLAVIGKGRRRFGRLHGLRVGSLIVV